MYLVSPSRTRLALGPGKAVLILGPMVIVLVDMESSKNAAYSLVDDRFSGRSPVMC